MVTCADTDNPERASADRGLVSSRNSGKPRVTAAPNPAETPPPLCPVGDEPLAVAGTVGVDAARAAVARRPARDRGGLRVPPRVHPGQARNPDRGLPGAGPLPGDERPLAAGTVRADAPRAAVARRPPRPRGAPADPPP